MLGVERLEHSIGFYRGVIGLDASEPVEWHGPAFERHWRLPAGAKARAAMLTAGPSDVGRILVAEFDRPAGEIVRARSERVFLGLANLNFYTLDIGAAVRRLVAAGCTTWTDPVEYEVGAGEGLPTEVIVEGPDGVLFNLVQPEGDEGSPVWEIRQFLDQHGTTRAGLSEVVTTAHAVTSIDDALGFYVDVLGLEVWIDVVFERVESNNLLGLADDARSRITFVRAPHPYGKIAMIEALNYDVVDLVPRAVPPQIGYLAMGFEVADLPMTLAACADARIETFSEPVALDVPGLGRRQAAVIRTPGSGALTQLLGAS